MLKKKSKLTSTNNKPSSIGRFLSQEPPNRGGIKMNEFKKRLVHVFSLETKTAPKLLLLPIVIFLLSLTVFPLIYAILTSLQYYVLSDPLAKRFVWLQNYTNMLYDERFWNSLVNTFHFIAVSLTLEMVLGIIMALLLARKFLGSGLAKTLLLLPTITTPVVVGLIWIMLYDPQFGLINYLLVELGFHPQAWLDSEKSAMWALIIVDVWEWTPFVALVLLAGLQSLPVEPYEAAMVDGASPFQRFIHLTLPLLKPYLIIAFLIRFMDAFRWFDTIYIMTKGGPGTATETVNMYGYLTGFNFLNMGYAATLGITMLVLITIISTLVVKTAQKGDSP